MQIVFFVELTEYRYKYVIRDKLNFNTNLERNFIINRNTEIYVYVTRA